MECEHDAASDIKQITTSMLPKYDETKGYMVLAKKAVIWVEPHVVKGHLWSGIARLHTPKERTGLLASGVSPLSRGADGPLGFLSGKAPVLRHARWMGYL